MPILVPALLAATTLASVVALAAEPIPTQTVQDEESDLTHAQALTTWNCYTRLDSVYRGQVTIWWGHTANDAMWACNQWIPACGTANGGCFAIPAR